MLEPALKKFKIWRHIIKRGKEEGSRWNM